MPRIKKEHRKFFVVGVLAVLLLGLFVFDYVRSRDTHIEVVSVTPKTIVADPNQPVTITLKVTKRGGLAVGDDVSALVIGQGNLNGDKVRVKEDGTVTFLYYPYSYIPGVFEESTVEIRFRNISDSVFIAVQKSETISLDVKKPDSSGGGTMGDLFGE